MTFQPAARMARPGLRDIQGSMRVVEVEITQKGSICASQSAQVGARPAPNALLPEVVETPHLRAPARFPRREEEEMDTQQQVQAHDHREAQGV
ncbi:MAG: hypothetical protein ABSG98_11935 [Anaerolineales bacterium]